MKETMKKTAFAVCTVLLTVLFCILIVSCGNTEQPPSTSGVFTLPEETKATTGTSSVETTATTGTSATTETTLPPETTGRVDPPVSVKYRNPLTGLPSEKDLSKECPLAIVVDNSDNALERQTGLGKADILYEALVTPGITRFLAVTADPYSIEAICNIRSGRDYHMDLAAYHNAVLMCHGGSITKNYDFFALAKERYGSRYGFIDTSEEPWFCQAENGARYGTIDHVGERKDLKHDTIYKPAALKALLSSSIYSKFINAGGSMEGSPRTSLKFEMTEKIMPSGAETATEIDYAFTCQGALAEKKINLRYKASSGQYVRYQDGILHRDSETGESLAFTNVILLFTKVDVAYTGLETDKYMTLVKTKGEGKGYYFYGGKVMEITWSADGRRLTLEDSNNNELLLAQGNTYIGYLDSDFAYGGDSFWK